MKTGIQIAIDELKTKVFVLLNSETKYRFIGAYQEAETDKEVRLQLEETIKELEKRMPEERKNIIDFANSYCTELMQSSDLEKAFDKEFKTDYENS